MSVEVSFLIALASCLSFFVEVANSINGIISIQYWYVIVDNTLRIGKFEHVMEKVFNLSLQEIIDAYGVCGCVR